MSRCLPQLRTFDNAQETTMARKRGGKETNKQIIENKNDDGRLCIYSNQIKKQNNVQVNENIRKYNRVTCVFLPDLFSCVFLFMFSEFLLHVHIHSSRHIFDRIHTAHIWPTYIPHRGSRLRLCSCADALNIWKT